MFNEYVGIDILLAYSTVKLLSPIQHMHTLSTTLMHITFVPTAGSASSLQPWEQEYGQADTSTWSS